jgi:hypothetical protein
MVSKRKQDSTSKKWGYNQYETSQKCGFNGYNFDITNKNRGFTGTTDDTTDN